MRRSDDKGSRRTAGQSTGKRRPGEHQRGRALPKPETSSIELAQTIGADYNAKTGKVTGGHTLINGDVRVKEVVTPPDEHGVYEAIVEIKTPNGEWKIKTAGASSKPQKNTMFPKEWNAQRVRVEIEHAWNNRIPHTDKTEGKWEGTSISGVKIEGYESPRATAYPVHGEKK